MSKPTVCLNLVLIYLTPMFLWAADGDLDIARQAALETLDAYRARTAISLITAARLIAFELASLASLSQSMDDDLAPELALRFRGNAVTLDRAAERNRAVLDRQRIPAAAAHLTPENAAAAVAEAQQRVQQAIATLQPAPPPAATRPPQPQAAAPVPPSQPSAVPVPPSAAAPVPPSQPSVAEPCPAQPTPPPAAAPNRPAAASPARPDEAERRAIWARAMTDVAAECHAGLDHLSPAERAKEMMRINLLTESASALVAGIAPSAPGSAAPATGAR